MLCGIERAFPETVGYVRGELESDCRRNGVEVTMKAVYGVAFCVFVGAYSVANVAVASLIGRAAIVVGIGGMCAVASQRVREWLESM